MSDYRECYYCGMPCDGDDHVTPKAVLAMMPDPESNPVRARTFTVPCCRECNSILGSKVFETLVQRKRALKERLRHKYVKYLRIPEWSPSELDELEGRLRESVEQALRIQRVTRSRLAW